MNETVQTLQMNERRSEATKAILQLKSLEINIFFGVIMMHSRREDIWMHLFLFAKSSFPGEYF